MFTSLCVICWTPLIYYCLSIEFLFYLSLGNFLKKCELEPPTMVGGGRLNMFWGMFGWLSVVFFLKIVNGIASFFWTILDGCLFNSQWAGGFLRNREVALGRVGGTAPINGFGIFAFKILGAYTVFWLVKFWSCYLIYGVWV